MKKSQVRKIIHSLIVCLALTGFTGMQAAASDVDVRGQSEPPFLAYGVNTNLLMLIDNSGSMLDMGYVDPNAQCFDETFSTTTSYAGNFIGLDPDTATSDDWYKWVQMTQDWRHAAYTVGDIVYSDGSFYRALTNGTSDGLTIDADTQVEWELLLQPFWSSTKTYHAHSFVFDRNRGLVYYTATGGPTPAAATSMLDDSRFLPPNGYRVPRWESSTFYAEGSYVLGENLKLYIAEADGTSSALSTKVTNDTGVDWNEADYHGWQRDIEYYPGDFVTEDGMIFQARGTYTFDPAPATPPLSIYEDNFSNNWQRLEEGYFELVTKTDALAFCRSLYTGVNDEWYASGDACATVYNTGAATDPQRILAFAASGNLLNWASASKFDIQKDVLTGGKYNSMAERVISENRGCGGNRFVKQIPIQQLAPANKPMMLTLSVRMALEIDKVDSNDDIARLEIYAITDNGMDFSACQAAIDFFQDPAGVAQVEQNTAACLGFAAGGPAPTEHIIYHKSMQACWYLAKQGSWKGGNDHLLVADNCQDIYWPDYPAGGTSNITYPANIGWSDPFYVCYGIYDTIPHDQRQGYIGRCWEPGVYTPVAGDTCKPVACDYGTPAACTSDSGALPCYFESGGTGYRCNNDKFVDACSGNFNAIQESCNKAWLDVFRDTVSGLDCTPASVQHIGFWEADFDDSMAIDNNTPEETSFDQCVDSAMKAFCQQLEVPEVIDPSDQASSTEDAWNLPGNLVEAGIVGQIGNPILVTKGFILQPEQPTGILHLTSQQLRIGAMAFNPNGAGTECTAAQPPIDKFCPRTNQDGAMIIAPIRLGSLLTDDNGTPADETDDQYHVDDMVLAINAVRATSWTPLAEAMYNAIGYYTQNTAVRINPTDFQTDSDVMAGWLDNTDYAPGSMVYESATQKLWHTVLGGRSQGADLATDAGVLWAEVGTFAGNWNAGPYNPNTIVKSANDKFYITYTGGIAAAKPASVGGPLYDDGIIWEPLIDPVAQWCQENHIVIITEGASTADIHGDVANFTQGTHAFNATAILDPNEAGADDPAAQCIDGLLGSTYLDDLTYFALNPDTNPDPLIIDRPFTLYPAGNDTLPTGDAPYTPAAKKNIITHIVTAGALRDNGLADECNPLNLMESAAFNGTETHDDSGSDLLRGETPAELRAALLELLSGLRQRASAGSAASVISSARGGEGAIYQAIFWPELKRTDETNQDIIIDWAGDVHGLFLDYRGYMYEDNPLGVGHLRQLEPFEDLDGDGHFDEDEGIGEDIDVDGHFDDVNEDVDGDGNLDVNEDKDDPNGDGIPEGDGNLDCGEDLNCDGILDPGEDRDGDGYLDLTEDLNGNGIFDLPVEDIDGDGYFDIFYEDVDRDGTLDVDEDLDNDGNLDNGEDFNDNYILDPGEDLDGDGVLDLTEDLDGDGTWDPFLDLDGDGFQDSNEDLDGDGVFDNGANLDRRVIVYYDNVLGRSMACYNVSIFRTGTCSDSAEIADVNFLWSASEWLADNTLDTSVNRDYNPAASSFRYVSSDKKRYIFTWNDLNNNGIVDDSDGIPGTASLRDEIIALETSVNWAGLTVSGNRGSVVRDFDLTSDAEVDMIVSWLRGNDWLTDEDANGDGVFDLATEDINGNGIWDKPLRSRQIPDANGSVNDITWRLGDIIHSTPMTVAQPAEGYHLIYNDFSYAQFLSKYKRRRHTVYFGANDGFLHAVNAGFYSEKEKKFCLVPLQADGTCDESVIPPEGVPELGAEMWAYLPYNLQPHVPFLANPSYVHKYYVDQRPRIFDAQIFTEEPECTDIMTGTKTLNDPNCIHPNGWGTILVGAMRFGGAKINATDMNLDPNDERQFTSAYFILDITNPEQPPPLLGELTRTTDGTIVDLGFSTIISTMVIMKGVDAMLPVNDWYLILGSGPHENYVTNIPSTDVLKGTSDQFARISVLPLNELADGTEGMRIPAGNPQAATSGAGTFVIDWWTSHTGAFTSDHITVDFDINPSYEDYKSDVVYFGTVDGHFDTGADGKTYWKHGGQVRRLVTKQIDTVPTGPYAGTPGSTFGRGHTEVVTYPWQWGIETLIDLETQDQPVTGAPSVGTDGENFWVYFGTGRFMDVDDKTDEIQQSYYGIKEPMVEDANGSKYMTWEKVERTSSGPDPGNKGLADVSLVQVEAASRVEDASLFCYPSTVAAPDITCLPWQVQPTPNLGALEEYIAGTKDCGADNSNCVDGWVKDFNWSIPNREKNVGQATLLGGLVTFTTYQPYKDICQAEGNAYLYGVYYKTGTPWREHIFESGAGGSNVKDRVNLGRGLATTPNLHVGRPDDPDDKQGPKAFVQTSTGEIKEIEQENLPISNYRTGRSKWKEYRRP